MSEANFAQAREFFLQGVRHTEAGRLADAERSFDAALSLVPGRTSTLVNLAVVKMRLGRADEALPLLEEAMAQEPDNPDTLGMRALALAELGHRPAALAAFDALLAKVPRNGTMWMQRGTLLVEMKRPEEAAASYRRALEHGADPELTRYYLAAVASARGETPPSAPREYVEGLFDKYADDFDVNLVQQLNYQAPAILAKRLAAMGRSFEPVLDLGCGTGLCGRIAKSFLHGIEGVDISARMLEKAAESGAYARLVHADVLEFLREATGPYALVISADVFIYVGDIVEVFAHVARCLAPGGVFCFSVEDAGEEGALVLKPSRRYAHSQAHVRELAAANALEVVDMQRAPIREDGGVPIPGLYFWLARSA